MENRKEFFDRHASAGITISNAEKQQQLSEVISWFGIKKGEFILDVGTGTGVLLPYLEEAVGARGKVAAIDFSLNMLKQAKMGESFGRKTLINAGVGAIPFRSGRFDRLTCFPPSPLPGERKALTMARVLRKGGYLLIAHLQREEINDSQRRGRAVIQTGFRIRRPSTMMQNSGLHKYQ
jgi:ubiquinone/menaquinone biosynthesis C-methylase UbiE